MKFAYDLAIYGGEVIDPVNNRQGCFDIGIRDGKIVEVSEELDRTQAAQTIDARGLYITPGLIDMHVHLSRFITVNMGIGCLLSPVSQQRSTWPDQLTRSSK